MWKMTNDDDEKEENVLERFIQNQMPMEKRLDKFDLCCSQGRGVFIDRNREYKDAFEFAGVLGIAVELIGLAGRLVALVIQRPDHGRGVEGKVFNALLDIHNFANMGMQLVSERNWDGRHDDRK